MRERIAANVTCTRKTLSAPELDEVQPPIMPRQAAATSANGPQADTLSDENPVPEKIETRLKSVVRTICSTGRSVAPMR